MARAPSPANVMPSDSSSVCRLMSGAIDAALDAFMRRFISPTAANHPKDQRHSKHCTRQAGIGKVGFSREVIPRKTKGCHERINVNYLLQDRTTL